MWVVSWWSGGLKIGCFGAVVEDVVSWWFRGVVWKYIKMMVWGRIKYEELEAVSRGGKWQEKKRRKPRKGEGNRGKNERKKIGGKNKPWVGS